MRNEVLEKLRKETLENGLTVLVRPVKNKVVTIDAWVNTGSANETETNNGISHFLEHMMFKGTPRYGVGELDKAIMGVGGVWNAGTSKDFTHYYVTVASPFFAKALDAMADMLQNASIDAGEFQKERSVILEEINRKEDSPVGVLYDEMYAGSYAAGPYKLTVLGTTESVTALTRDAMYDYYQRYYTPDNMVLLIVGDIEPTKVLQEVRQAFSGFQRRLRPLESVPGAPSYANPGSVALAKDVNETYLGLTYPAPSIDKVTEVLALDLASTILEDGRSSRLYRRLKEEKRLVSHISAGYPTSRHEGLYYVLATLEQRNIDTALEEIRAVFGELAATPPTDVEMAKARRILRNTFQYGMETNTGQTGTYGYYFTLTGSTDFVDTYLDRLAHITASDVAAVVGKYLLGQPNVVRVEPLDGQQAA
ncbi:MAG: insulinase family protein [Candidatus Sumerlaeaceae bacterium]|nr:insulinase family protein [Candidatus Sumerlaeaceae bacterium]